MPTKKKFSYSVTPALGMVQNSMKKLVERTGLTIDDWVARVKSEGPPTEKERREWLKTEHDMGTNYAKWIAGRAEGHGIEDGDPEAYLKAAEKNVEAMFSGARSSLIPLYEKLLTVGVSVGKEAKACPCQTIVPLYRNHVFAQIKPATKTRIDFGFALKDLPASGRLIDTGGFLKKDRITHRIPIFNFDDIDDEFMHWLRMAYDLDS